MQRPTALTLGLTATLATAGVAVALRAPERALLPQHHGAALIALTAALCVAFVLSELGQALVEVRSQAYSFSLSGVPLLLGLLYLPPTVLVVARVGAAVLAFALQRASPVKFAYNTAAYLLDVALVVVLAHRLVGESGTTLSLRTIALCYVAIALVDLLMSTLVLVVIGINQGPMTAREAIEVLGPAAFFVAFNTAVGATCAVLLSHGALGVVLLVAFVAVTTAGYRAYLVLRARHRSLQVVQEFIQQGEETASADELVERLLHQMQELVRASSVELTVERGQGGAQPAGRLRVTVRGSEPAVVEPASERPGDALLPKVLGGRSHALVSDASAEPVQREWLALRGVPDALVVALDQHDARGTIVALDRIGDTTRFSADDLALLVTLAGHFAVALQSHQLVERLQHEGTHDVLTGLPNRAFITERMRGVLAERTPDRRAAVLLLDLNRFKEVNDALGHDVGDQLLQVVARRLTALCLRDATVARLGGDEFAVFLPPSDDAEGSARRVADSICSALAAPVDLPDVTISCEVSIGIAVAIEGQSQTDLLRHADTAMYAAKDSALPWQTYSPHLDQGRAERLAMLADLRMALDRGELTLAYQPKLDLELGVVTSVEALVRWTHPTLGPLPPDAFVPLAESTGLIEQLTRTVLAQALHHCRAWQDAGLDLAVAVNLSARNVNNPDLPDQVAAALAEAGLLADRLILEITESSVMGDPARTVPTLNRLAALGVTLSLDDFGTGYSSLAYLQRLPVREVKIDRSFVLGLSHLTEGRASTALVRSIITMGRSLDLNIVAEGVETQETLELLRGFGCQLAQGFHIARPVPAHELVATIEAAGRVVVGRTADT